MAIILVAAAGVGELAIAAGALATLLTAVVAVVMLGPNRSSKAMEIAEKAVTMSGRRADDAEENEARIAAELVLVKAREEALMRRAERLAARLREAGLDDS